MSYSTLPLQIITLGNLLRELIERLQSANAEMLLRFALKCIAVIPAVLLVIAVVLDVAEFYDIYNRKDWIEVILYTLASIASIIAIALL